MSSRTIPNLPQKLLLLLSIFMIVSFTPIAHAFADDGQQSGARLTTATITAQSSNGISTASIQAICNRYNFKNNYYWTSSSKDAWDTYLNPNRYVSTSGFMASASKLSYEYRYENTYQCIGFAKFIGAQLTGENCYGSNKWSSWTLSSGDSLQPGDVLRSSGHAAVVYSVSGSSFTVAECLGDSGNLLKIGTGGFNCSSTTVSNLVSRYSGIKVYRYNGYVPPIDDETVMTIADGVYTIHAAKDRAKVVDVEGSSYDDGANVYLWDSTCYDNQQFRFIRNSDDGTYRIQNVRSGKSLDVAGGSTENNANVQQYAPNNTGAQRWYVIDAGDGQIRLKNKGSGKYLDILYDSMENGTNLQICQYSSSTAQKFFLVTYSEFGNRTTSLESGYYVMRSGLDKTYAIDADGGSVANGTNIQIWGILQGNSQIFHIVKQSNGYYTIHPKNSDAVAFEVAGGGMVNSVNVRLYETNYTRAQLWIPRSLDNGAYAFQNVLSGKYLDVWNGSAAPGTNVQQYLGNGSNSQKFFLEPWDKSIAGSRVKVTGVDGVYEYSGTSVEPSPSVLWRCNSYDQLRMPSSGTATSNGEHIWTYNMRGGRTYVIEVDKAERLAGNANYAQLRAVGSNDSDVVARVNVPWSDSKQTFTLTVPSNCALFICPAPSESTNGTAAMLEGVRVYEQLVSGTDYSLSYSDNTSAGQASVTVTGKGDYSNSKTIDFTIANADLPNEDLVAAEAAIARINAIGTVTLESKDAIDAARSAYDSLTADQKALVPASTYKILTDAEEAYSVALEESENGAPIEIDKPIASVFTYDGFPHEGVAQGAGFTLSGTTSATVAGSYKATAKLDSGYVWRDGSLDDLELDWEIFPSIVTDMTLSQESFTYTGASQKPDVASVKSGSIILGTSDYDVAYSNPNSTAPNTYTVTVSGKGNFEGSVSAGYIINSASIATSAVTLSPTACTYDGKAKTPTATVKLGSKTLASGTDYTVSYSNNVNAGTATVTVTGKGNYSGSKSATFKINPAAITSVSTTAGCAYDGTAKKPSVTVKAGSLAVPASGYTVAYRNNVNAGTATVTVTGKGNYSGSRSATFKITPASLATATVALSQSAYTYDGKAKTPAATVKLGSKTLKAGTDYTVSYSNNVKPGLATATVTGKGNYSDTAKATFSIAAASTPSTPSAPAVSEPEPVPAYPLYRLFQPKTGEHHYTLSAEERDICTDRWGWTYEGVAWDCPEASATPVYRLFHPTIGLHHYTTSAEERDICTDRWGWQYEGVAWYADDDDSGMPVYRLFHPVTAHHHYTTSWDEVEICTGQWGWQYEGVAWYARE